MRKAKREDGLSDGPHFCRNFQRNRRIPSAYQSFLTGTETNFKIQNQIFFEVFNGKFRQNWDSVGISDGIFHWEKNSNFFARINWRKNSKFLNIPMQKSVGHSPIKIALCFIFSLLVSWNREREGGGSTAAWHRRFPPSPPLAVVRRRLFDKVFLCVICINLLLIKYIRWI